MTNFYLLIAGTLLFLISSIMQIPAYKTLNSQNSEKVEKARRTVANMMLVSVFAAIIFLIGWIRSWSAYKTYLTGCTLSYIDSMGAVFVFSFIAVAIIGVSTIFCLVDEESPNITVSLYSLSVLLVFVGLFSFACKTQNEFDNTEYRYCEITSVEYSIDEINGPTYIIKTADGELYNAEEDNIIIKNSSEPIDYLKIELCLHPNDDGSERIFRITAYLNE